MDILRVPSALEVLKIDRPIWQHISQRDPDRYETPCLELLDAIALQKSSLRKLKYIGHNYCLWKPPQNAQRKLDFPLLQVLEVLELEHKSAFRDLVFAVDERIPPTLRKLKFLMVRHHHLAEQDFVGPVRDIVESFFLDKVRSGIALSIVFDPEAEVTEEILRTVEWLNTQVRKLISGAERRDLLGRVW